MSMGRTAAGIAAGRVFVALTCAILLAGCATPQTGATPSQPATVAATAPEATPVASLPASLPASMRPWPTVGQAPETDSVTGLYLSYQTWGDISGPVEKLTIFADGRVVAPVIGVGHPRYLSRRLNQAGLAFIRAQVATIGLFDHSQTRKVAHSPDCCGGGDQISIVSAGKTIEVAAARLPDGSFAPSEAWDRFEALVQSLAQPDAWIPSTGWSEGTWSPFHPSTYCLILARDLESDPAPLAAADLTWPAGVLPFASFGEPAGPAANPDDRVGTVPAAAAYQLAGSIAQVATAASLPADDLYVTPLADGGSLLSPWIADPDGGLPIRVDLWPASPGLLGCALG